MRQKIAVIGGGASGVFAAISAARNGAEVTIFEHQDRILKKILLTGNGKCNLTNYHMSIACFKTDSVSTDVIQNTLSVMSPKQLVAAFKEMGMPTKTLRESYVYPETEAASTVVQVLLRQIKKYQITVLTNVRINKLLPEKGGFFIVTDSSKQYFDKVICAVGGKSYAKTGSDGSFYKQLKDLQISLNPGYPVLTAMYSSRPGIKSLAGLRVDGTATLYINQKKVAFDVGQIQMTDYGISGIPVFQLSKEAAYELKNHPKDHDVHVCLDLFDQYSIEELVSFMDSQISDYAGLSIEEALVGLFPKKLLDYILHEQKLAGKKAYDITPKQIQKLANVCKNFDYPITDVKGLDFAQVTGGGVCLDQINDHYMVKALPGLYIVGEVLDITGICGGYNLHFAFASGKIAGEHAAKG